MRNFTFGEDHIKSIPIHEQRLVVFEMENNDNITKLKDNLKAPACDVPNDFDESLYSSDHYLDKNRGYAPPATEVVRHYLDQLKAFDDQYTGKRIANILGIDPRRLREYKQGKVKFPFHAWRKFLIITGRATQTIEHVIMIADLAPTVSDND